MDENGDNIMLLEHELCLVEGQQKTSNKYFIISVSLPEAISNLGL